MIENLFRLYDLLADGKQFDAVCIKPRRACCKKGSAAARERIEYFARYAETMNQMIDQRCRESFFVLVLAMNGLRFVCLKADKLSSQRSVDFKPAVEVLRHIAVEVFYSGQIVLK